MYRFLLLALAVVCLTVVALRDGQRAADTAPEPALWNQTYTALPATHVPPFSPGSNWSGRLNPAGTVFDSGFRAFYFDRTNPSFKPFERQVDAIALSYSYDELHGIDSGNLGAYWVGRVKFEKDTLRRISMNLSHATVRLFIDGKLVYEGGENHILDYRFSAGFHLIEVDYINRWHTTDFAVSLGEPLPVRSRADIADQVSQLNLSNYDIYYFGVYESDEAGEQIALELPDSPRAALVWLDSYEPVKWSLESRRRAVWAIVASYEPGASIMGVRRERVFLTRENIGVYSEGRANCRCLRGYFHCEDDGSISEAAHAVVHTFGKTIAGYSVAYDPTAMRVRTYDRSAQTRLQRAEADVTRQEALCRA